MSNGEGVSVLSYAVRPWVVIKYLGELSLALAVLTLAPLAVSLGYGEAGAAWRYLAVMALLAALWLLGRRVRAPALIQVNEALVITALAFLVASLLMAWPLMPAGLSFMDAWFEAVSGVTTTGLSTLARVEDLPPGFLFARAWMQWHGGLGVAVLTAALLLGPGIVTRRLSGADSGDLAAGARIHARRVLWIYLTLTVGGILLLWPLSGDLMFTLAHVMAAVSTGGFSSLDAGMGGMPRLLQGALTLVATLGAISLPLYWLLWRREVRGVFKDPQTLALLAAALLVALPLTLSLLNAGAAPGDALADGLLLAFNAQTTTGFAPVPVDRLDAGSRLLLILSMLGGGSLGSTAGGVKLLRVLILLHLLRLLLDRTRLPDHAVVEPRLGGQRLHPEESLRVMLVVLLFLGVVILSWLPFLYYGYDPLDSLFEVVSATATCGLSTGISSAALETPLKLLLCLDMLCGRLEVLALLLLFYPPTWLGRRNRL